MKSIKVPDIDQVAYFTRHTAFTSRYFHHRPSQTLVRLQIDCKQHLSSTYFINTVYIQIDVLVYYHHIRAPHMARRSLNVSLLSIQCYIRTTRPLAAIKCSLIQYMNSKLHILHIYYL